MDFRDTAYDLQRAGMAIEQAGQILAQPMYYPGSGGAMGYPAGGPGYYPDAGYAPGYAPPGTVTGGVDTKVPVIPVALGALAGWYWKKSPLAAVVGAIGGFILGNMIGSVAVQSQVQATPLQPSSIPYGY